MFLLFEGFHPQIVLILFLFSIKHYLLTAKFTPYINLCLFLASVTILHPSKTPENLDFLVFVGGIKWEHWPEVG